MNGFRHVVLFRWAEGTTTSQREEVAIRLAELATKVPGIVALRFGADAGVNPDTFEFALVADFADRDGYLGYRDHPEHRAFVTEVINPIVAERATVQYEI